MALEQWGAGKAGPAISARALFLSTCTPGPLAQSRSELKRRAWVNADASFRGQMVGPVTGSIGQVTQEAEALPQTPQPSPQTQHDKALRGGRLNSVSLSSKNPTPWMMASYNRDLEAEAGPRAEDTRL